MRHMFTVAIYYVFCVTFTGGNEARRTHCDVPSELALPKYPFGPCFMLFGILWPITQGFLSSVSINCLTYVSGNNRDKCFRGVKAIRVGTT